ncbi:MAG: hypothetical protein AB1467_02990 [Candidatus Diapherotrites archaeon]
MFGFSKKKDPVCGMTQEKGKGIEKQGKWFCSQACLEKYGAGTKESGQSGSCCG